MGLRSIRVAFIGDVVQLWSRSFLIFFDSQQFVNIEVNGAPAEARTLVYLDGEMLRKPVKEGSWW